MGRTAPRRTGPRRADVLRAVIATADRRRDAVLPTDVPGVAATFRDELDLVGALQLRWYTRLCARIEREQAAHPGDLLEPVLTAWCAVADEMPGVRLVLDLARLRPTDDATERAMVRATAKEHALLAASAGLAAPSDLRRGAEVGARVEAQARLRWDGPQAAPRADRDRSASVPARLVGRLRAALV